MAARLSLLFACLTLGCSQPPMVRSDVSPDQAAVARAVVIPALGAAQAAAETGDFVVGLESLKPIVDSPIYGHLTPAKQYEIDRLLGEAANYEGERQVAHDAYVRATAYSAATAEDWFGRLDTAMRVHDFADVAKVIPQVRRKGGSLEWFGEGRISTIDEGLGTLPDNGKARFEFEKWVLQVGWPPENPFFSPDVIRYHYANGLIARGEVERAGVIARSLLDPEVLALVRADRRYDRFFDMPAAEHVQSAAAAELARRRKQARVDPDWIFGRAGVAETLFLLDRPAEALAEADAMLNAGAQMSLSERRGSWGFVDAMNSGQKLRADLLFETGRQGEALGLISAVENGTNPERAADRALVRSRLLLWDDRGAEALTVLAPLGDGGMMRFSRQGEMLALRACAAQAAGDAAALKTSLKTLTDHPNRAPAAALRALLCTDDLAGASALAVKMLGEPVHRHLVLQELQRHAAPPASGRRAMMEQRLEALRARPEVVAALSKVGRINSYPTRAMGPLY